MESCSKPQLCFDESDNSQINTANSSPLMAAGQKGIKSFRSSRTSKFAKQMRESTISSFDHEGDIDTTFNCRYESRSRHFSKIEPTKSEYVSVNFLVPIELLAKDFILTPNQKIKSGFLIEALNIKLEDLNSQTINCLIKQSIDTINCLLFKRKTAFNFSEDISKFSLRVSKKSGLPDFDFPSKYLYKI